ncbi:Cysteine-rich RLK (RECEPTOR-like protein kinase) 8 [Theobroma cacao]|uniref:Cysteine-rich RLK (RECEPTOR-like protein kinase) 8 n=1 Tax=Theobroma cacao TaxID=3641 RepID=A0A061FNT8_THECC|nr:Cysteine-rich RLK (RECEPTOR-like protein kinase) 8 [Theobroma cacao]
MFDKFKESMMKEFDMTDLGRLHYFLGLEMEKCIPVLTLADPSIKLDKDLKGKDVDGTYYKHIVRSLMYLTTTRLDIMYAVSLIIRYMDKPKQSYLLVAKRILRYLQGTTSHGLLYKKGENSMLIGFTDRDYAGDRDDRKSTTGFVFKLESNAISWSSKKQPIITLSTTEAKFVAATACACQSIWLKKLLKEIYCKQTEATPIYCDNSSAIKLSKNPVFLRRSKHIDVRYHFLRDLTRDGIIAVVYCKSEDQAADIFTKP